MNWEQLESKWTDFAGSARAHWAKLTADDWQAITGKKEQLVGRVQERYGITNDEAEKQVTEWSVALPDFAQAAKRH